MKIIFASSEVTPFSKTGGLADVAGSLPKALYSLGENVEVITPFYNKFLSKYKTEGPILKLVVPVSDRLEEATVFETYIDKIPVYLIRNDKYFDREYLYSTPEGDYKDNAERFVFFSRAVLEFCRRSREKYDIIHCHDWQTGLVPTFMKIMYKPNFPKTKTVFTIHNIGYQGLFWHYDMHLLNIGWEWFNYKFLEFYGRINLLKAGIVFSDLVTTVSESYSKQIQTEEFGAGLHGVLQNKTKDLYGIVNGIDYEIWDPARDKSIAQKFDMKDLSGKEKCREELAKIFNLTGGKSPIIAMITRLSVQKGLDIVTEVIDKIIKMGFQLVILGAGEKKYIEIVQKMAQIHKGKAGIKIAFDEDLAHKIYAGCDFFLMPSQYEPCGLNQMISMKYGSIPVVRATGGLNDTVNNFNPASGRGNGFKFEEYSSKALLDMLGKALTVYNDKQTMQKLIKNAMSADFSWDKSAEEYIKLYQLALKKPS